MVGIGVEQSRSEKSSGMDSFTVEQAGAIVSFFKISLFQHYKLYEFLFNHPRDELVLGAEQEVELIKPVEIQFPAPLEEGIPYDIYCQFVAPPPADKTGDELDEQQPEDFEENLGTNGASEVDPLAGYTMEDVKSVLGQVIREVVGSLQTEINEKLRLQEEAYVVRMEKLKKI
uniref:Ciliary associated calcium binding coiled-coil 1 n=2 Tax=Latimeria chalumnae TaxID=7897 RepID=M3XIX2_LATCH|nr:PREDICTED: uncharacterized protein C10orf107 homolog [Latimeria chalumnae]|eukprot:XP_014344958.1 PREDICTED: uncharacterized protein C10orf107 homolog [Latimeria chalumnae]